LLHAFFRPHLAMTPLRFANPSPPSGWIEDFHLQAVVHTRHTTKTPAAVFPARALQNSCDDAVMPLICPTCQILTENSANQIRKIETNSASRAAQNEKARSGFPGAGL
jgi:hypothetical protein